MTGPNIVASVFGTTLDIQDTPVDAYRAIWRRAFSRQIGYKETMNKPAKIKAKENYHTPEFEKAVREGLASLDAGKGIPYSKIRRWLLSWGTKNELPPPK